MSRRMRGLGVKQIKVCLLGLALLVAVVPTARAGRWAPNQDESRQGWGGSHARQGQGWESVPREEVPYADRDNGESLPTERTPWLTGVRDGFFMQAPPQGISFRWLEQQGRVKIIPNAYCLQRSADTGCQKVLKVRFQVDPAKGVRWDCWLGIRQGDYKPGDYVGLPENAKVQVSEDRYADMILFKPNSAISFAECAELPGSRHIPPTAERIAEVLSGAFDLRFLLPASARNPLPLTPGAYGDDAPRPPRSTPSSYGQAPLPRYSPPSLSGGPMPGYSGGPGVSAPVPSSGGETRDSSVRLYEHGRPLVSASDVLVGAGDVQSPGGSGPLAWPVRYKCKIWSPFGPRTSPPGNHQGIDIGAPTGVSGNTLIGNGIYAATSGRITEIQTATKDSYITVDNGNGIKTNYFHFVGMPSGLKLNDYVEAGQRIASVGDQCRRCNAAHLHFEVWMKRGQKYEAVNPMLFFPNACGY
jgi:hypothetical protein